MFLRRYLSPEKCRRLGRKRLTAILTKAAWGKFSDEKAQALWRCVENAPPMDASGDDVLLEANVQIDALERLDRDP